MPGFESSLPSSETHALWALAAPDEASSGNQGLVGTQTDPASTQGVSEESGKTSKILSFLPETRPLPNRTQFLL